MYSTGYSPEFNIGWRCDVLVRNASLWSRRVQSSACWSEKLWILREHDELALGDTSPPSLPSHHRALSHTSKPSRCDRSNSLERTTKATEASTLAAFLLHTAHPFHLFLFFVSFSFLCIARCPHEPKFLSAHLSLCLSPSLSLSLSLSLCFLWSGDRRFIVQLRMLHACML